MNPELRQRTLPESVKNLKGLKTVMNRTLEPKP